MKLESISIKNSRFYQEEITVYIDELTTFFGKNNIGKFSLIDPDVWAAQWDRHGNDDPVASWS